MRLINAGIFTAAAMAMTTRSLGFDILPIEAPEDRPSFRDGPSLTLKVGRKYPFSSKRQQDRNARQLEAGKLQFA